MHAFSVLTWWESEDGYESIALSLKRSIFSRNYKAVVGLDERVSKGSQLTLIDSKLPPLNEYLATPI